jgi:octaprenyl-diphosphate synthase
MRQFIRAHFGQTLDLYWTGKMSPRSLQNWQEDSHSSKILQMYEFKSAAIVEGLVETVAIIARADTKTRNACIDFGRFLGVAFQIIDDIHNFSNSPKWRKERGEDLRAGKLTYVLFKAVQSLNGSAQKRLQDIICSEKLRKESKNIEEGVQLVQKSGALEQCREEAKSLMEPAVKTITETLPASESKILLLYLCQHLLDSDLNETWNS